MMNKRNIELSVLNCNLIFDAIGLKEKPFEAYQTAFLVKILRGPYSRFKIFIASQIALVVHQL